MKVVRWSDEALARGVAWLDDRWHLGALLRGAFTIVVVALPTLQAFSGAREPAWIVPFIAPFGNPEWLLVLFPSLFALFLLSRYKEGGPARRMLRRLGYINGSFAGAIDSYGSKIAATNKRRLSDSECEALCAALLHRIKDFAQLALDVEDSPRLRATLAVPYDGAGGDDVPDSLRVWCYDESHADRGYTVIPLEINGCVAPGAPSAYLLGGWHVIHDIESVPGVAARAARPYRAVLSFAVPFRDAGSGRPLAIISIDADEPNFFSRASVVERLEPLVSPVASAIGLVLSSRRSKGGPYAFPA